ncbi:MAG: signal peptidase I [Schleiferilactobacillus harbinensis]|jgi:signal peptidase I|nr:signal peptidase I [Schleiferilactobacillus harbinensis]MCI1913014.1 signal peptidase I [Schleiferilactobacillus harbinensis]
MEKQDNKKKQNGEEDESFGKWFLQTLGLTAVFVGIVALLFSFVLSNDQVSGPSMQPTFESGDRVIALRHDKIDRGDVVVLDAPDAPGTLYIKRVIGMPGDTVESKNDVMYINGKKLAQPYLKDYESELPTGVQYTDDFSLASKGFGNNVPKGEYFVMGDHRNVSKDSRIFGYVKASKIVGVVKLRYWPLTQIKTF